MPLILPLCAQVIIAGAGGAAHLPGMVAAMTPLPVIGVPCTPAGCHLDGVDALLSIAQMPRGVPVATVAVGNATNAGALAWLTAFTHSQRSSSSSSPLDEGQVLVLELSAGTVCMCADMVCPAMCIFADSGTHPRCSHARARVCKFAVHPTTAYDRRRKFWCIAGLLAVRMLGVKDPAMVRSMSTFQESQKALVERKARQLEDVGWEAYLEQIAPAKAAEKPAAKKEKSDKVHWVR